MKNRGVLNLIAFLLFITGFTSLVFMLIGAKLVFLQWIDYWGSLTGFVIRIIFIVVGIVLSVVANSNFSGEEESFDYLDKK